MSCSVAFAEGGIDLTTYMVRYYSRLAIMEDVLNVDVELIVIDPPASGGALHNFDTVTAITDNNGIVESAAISTNADISKIIAFIYGLRDEVSYDTTNLKYGIGWASTYESDLKKLDSATIENPFTFGAYVGFRKDTLYYFSLRK